MKTLKRWIKNIRWLLNHPPTNMTDDRSLELTCEFCRNHANCVKLGDTITVCFTCIARAFREILSEKLPANIIGPCAVQALKYMDDAMPKTTKRKPPTMKKTKKVK